MNPMQMIQNLMLSNTNPMLKNLMKLAEKGDSKSLEEFAKNVCKERGIDFDKEYQNFINNFR